jgi:hypothetical protein
MEMETYLFSIKRSQEALLIFILLYGALSSSETIQWVRETEEYSSCTLNSLWERWERDRDGENKYCKREERRQQSSYE